MFIDKITKLIDDRRSVRTRMNAVSRIVSDYNIDVYQFFILVSISTVENCDNNKLSVLLDCSSQHISNKLRALYDEEWVIAVVKRVDRRMTCIEFTDQGRERFNEMVEELSKDYE